MMMMMMLGRSGNNKPNNKNFHLITKGQNAVCKAYTITA